MTENYDPANDESLFEGFTDDASGDDAAIELANDADAATSDPEGFRRVREALEQRKAKTLAELDDKAFADLVESVLNPKVEAVPLTEAELAAQAAVSDMEAFTALLRADVEAQRKLALGVVEDENGVPAPPEVTPEQVGGWSDATFRGVQSAVVMGGPTYDNWPRGEFKNFSDWQAFCATAGIGR